MAVRVPNPQAVHDSQGIPSQAVITIPQYRVTSIAAIWAAAALPMAALAWVVAPLLASDIEGGTALVSALLLCLTGGLVWQCLLVLLLVRREQGSVRWPVLRDALWLRAPRSPRTGRVGGRVWLMLVPFVVVFAAEQFVPTLPVPAARDFAAFLQSGAGQAFFNGSWGWFALVVAMGLFNTVLGEELLFRGFLLPRMRGAFGRGDWLANGLLFALYHLHTPWVIPTTLIDAFCLALPTRRYRSAWFGIAVHSTQTIFISLGVLALVR
jgi:membrane protease YdiL (CAAX protease family)